MRSGIHPPQSSAGQAFVRKRSSCGDATRPDAGLAGITGLLNRAESGLSWCSCVVVQLPRHCEGEPEMTELQILARNTQALKELLRVAWRDLANPMLTPFERREARNQINQYAADLRHHLALMEAEQRR